MSLAVAFGGAAEFFAQTNLKMVHAFFATAKDGKPATEFSAETPKINVIWRCDGLEVGDKIRAVWMAEDVGGANPAEAKSTETKISEKMVMAVKPNQDGSFFLARPAGRTWPIGKYRVDFFINDNLAQAVTFSVTPGVKIDTH